MNEAEIKKILAYCEKASEGPWGKNPSTPKSIITNPKDKKSGQKSVCTLDATSPAKNWGNYHFITNARRDLPALAKDCLEMLDLIERATKQLELSREKKQWLRLKKVNKQLKLEQSTKRLELAKTSKKHLELEKENEQFQLENDQLQLEINRKQTELQALTADYQAKLMEKQAQLEQTRLQHKQEIQNKQTQMEQATQKLGEELNAANKQLKMAINHIREQEEKSKDDFYGTEDNKEGIPGLLGKLDKIEAYLDSPLEIGKTSKDSPIADPQDEEPQPFDQEMLKELDAIGDQYDPHPTETTAPAATQTDLAATASEFAMDNTAELNHTELTETELTETA